MEVNVSYPVVETMIIDIPDELAIPYQKAHEENDYEKGDEYRAKIDDYIFDYIFSEFGGIDWVDWEEVD